ncbi:MAG: hypothetical protein K2W97_07095 [Chthoniobacterales bacterium]|nr:hypothetical protein [Chthoniobacterales bacterium]
MENINPSPNVNLTNSPEISSQGVVDAASAEDELAGELGGLKVEVAESLPRNFSSLTDPSSFGSTSDLSSKGDDASPHQIVQIHPSATSTSLTTMDSSSSLGSKKDSDLGKSGTKSSLLEQKIKAAEGVTFSPSIKGYVDFNECQSRYVNNLQRALIAINRHIPEFTDEMTAESINVKISLAVDSIIELADNIKELSNERIVSRLEGRSPAVTGSLGEAQESIEHYLDYIQALKIGESKKTGIDFCLAKKCENRFKQIEAREKGDQKASDLYSRSFHCYQEVLEASNFHEVSRALGRAGDKFSQAAKELENKRPDISELYEKAGACFEQKSDCYKAKKSIEAMNFADYQQALYLTKAGTSFSSAAKATHAGNLELREIFQAAGNCFQGAVQKLSKGGSQAWKEFQFLEQAGDHFLEAAEAMSAGEAKLAGLQQVVGRSLQAAAHAMEIGEREALSRFQDSYKMFSYALKADRKKDVPLSDVYQKIGTYSDAAGNALLKGQQKIAQLYTKAASCLNGTLKNTKEGARVLTFASTYFAKAVDSLKEGDQEAAKLYELAGEYTQKAASAQNPNIKYQLGRVASCYLKIIERKGKGFQEEDSAIQLFRSACSYNQTVAEEIAEGPDQDEETLISLGAASLNLFLAAQVMEQGDKELADVYANCAASHHYLVIARNPALLERFPRQFQIGFKKESVPNVGLIKYWENAAKANHLQIEQLLEERGQTLS